MEYLSLIIIVVVVLILLKIGIRRVTILEYEKGLKYSRGKLKEMFAQVVNARKEGLAAIEKARGETAALRNLANAAKMIENNPNLLHLRLLQTLGVSSGNTLVLGIPANSTTIPIKTKEGIKKVLSEDPSEHKE